MQQSLRQNISVAFSLHRPEMMPFIAEQMQRHEAIFLEEPPTPGFAQMLAGELSVEEYLLPVDAEYPNFSRKMCRVLRGLHAEGKRIYQVEPFIESLLQIHELFAAGGRPADLDRGSLHAYVYRAERAATGALLTYYQTVAAGSFEAAVDAVIRFARTDAARFRLRDSLRAQALSALIPRHGSAYIEAGLMHYRLWQQLRKRLGCDARVRPVFTADTALKRLGEMGHLYGPGDRLTLLYIFHPAFSNPELEKLLAARSMIYSKVLEKQESDGQEGPFPHLRDELACIRATRRLSVDDCRQLFTRMRRTGTRQARRTLARFVAA